MYVYVYVYTESKVIALKPDKLNSVPGIHTLRRNMAFTNCSFTSTHIMYYAHKHVCILREIETD